MFIEDYGATVIWLDGLGSREAVRTWSPRGGLRA